MKTASPKTPGAIRWAASLPRASAEALGALRLRSDVSLCDLGATLWLRGTSSSDDVDTLLRQIPGADRFEVSAENAVTRVGARVPSGTLPKQSWIPLSEWHVLQPQSAHLPSPLPPPISLRWIPDPTESPAGFLLTESSLWRAYGDDAPAARLKHLRFALAADGRVLIGGTPLPPIPGQQFVDREGIAAPCGWTWSPSLDPLLLREWLALASGDAALFQPDGSWERIERAAFVRATRSAIRISCPPERKAAP